MAGPGPREDYLQDEKYFMSVAVLTAKRSRDPNTQVGACIVKDRNVISLGYNHMPIGDDKHDWAKSGSDNKYLYVCYAVNHAILNVKGVDLKGASLYVTLFPSNECAMEIIIAGIKNVFYMDDRHAEKSWCQAAKKMLNEKTITFKQVEAFAINLAMPGADGSDPYYSDLK